MDDQLKPLFQQLEEYVTKLEQENKNLKSLIEEMTLLGILDMMKEIKTEQGNPLTFYPQYCNSCMLCFVSKERHSKCRSCGSIDTSNCYGEKYGEKKESEEVDRP